MAGMAPKPPVRIPSIPTRRAGRAARAGRAVPVAPLVPVVRPRSPPGRGRRGAGGGPRRRGRPARGARNWLHQPEFRAKNRGIPAETPAFGTDSQENVAGIARGSPDRLPFLPTVGPGDPPQPSGIPPQTISLRAFSGSARTTLRAGLAGIVIGAPVKGFVRDRACGGGLAHHLELQESGEDELAGALLAQLLGEERAQGGEDGGDLLLAQPGRLGQSGVDDGLVGGLGSGGARRVGGLGGGLARPERWRPCPWRPWRPEPGWPCPRRPSRPEGWRPCPGRPWVRLSWPWSWGRSRRGWTASIGSCGPGRAGSPGPGPDEDRSGDDLIAYRKRPADAAPLRGFPLRFGTPSGTPPRGGEDSPDGASACGAGARPDPPA